MQGFTIADVKKAIEGSGGNISMIAKRLGKSTSTIYRWLKQYPELQAAYEKEDGKVEGRPQYTKELFEKAIEGSRGIKTVVAKRAGVSVGTVDNYLQRYPELQKQLDAEKSTLVDLAQSKLAKMLINEESSGHVRAVFFTLETLGKDRGFSKRQELTGEGGTPLFSPEVTRYIEDMGMDVTNVQQEFEQMIRIQHTLSQGDD